MLYKLRAVAALVLQKEKKEEKKKRERKEKKREEKKRKEKKREKEKVLGYWIFMESR